MKRPYVFCHMLISLDGKIMCSYMDNPQGTRAGAFFYPFAFGRQRHSAHQECLSDRVTCDDNFTPRRTPDLSLVHAKRKECFGIEMLMLGGGGVLNWSYASAADGDPTTPALFCANVRRSVSFALTHAQRVDDDTPWLRYRVLPRI